MRLSPSMIRLVAPLLLAACAQASPDTAPPAASPSSAATVVVLRARDLSSEPVEVSVNGRVIARLLPDQWRRFPIDTGTQTIGSPGSEISVSVQPRARYWFLVSTGAGELVRRMDSTEAVRRLAEANSPRNTP